MDLATLSKKKKGLLVAAFVLFVIMAIAGLACAFSMNYNTYVPSAPSILDDGKSILITTSMNENYKKYRFKFQSATSEVVIESTANVLTEQEIYASELVVGTNYKVSASYVGDDNKNYFGDSVNWTYSIMLETPVLYNNTADQTITWSSIENADYYMVYYKSGNVLRQQKSRAPMWSYRSWLGGEVEFYVVACSESAAYKNSDASQTMSFIHKKKLQPLFSAIFSAPDRVLTINAKEKLEYVEIIIGINKYVVKLSSGSQSANIYTYTVNLSAQYQPVAEIGVSPYPPNEYHVYDGDITIVSTGMQA